MSLSELINAIVSGAIIGASAGLIVTGAQALASKRRAPRRSLESRRARTLKRSRRRGASGHHNAGASGHGETSSA